VDVQYHSNLVFIIDQVLSSFDWVYFAMYLFFIMACLMLVFETSPAALTGPADGSPAGAYIQKSSPPTPAEKRRNFIIFGSVFIAIAIVVWLDRRKKQRDLLQIKAGQTSRISDLTDICRSVGEEMGATGGFKQDVEVQGVVQCDDPLTGDMSKRPCVYLEISVTSHRNMGSSWKSEAVSNRNQRVNFFVRDQTGAILVNPTDAAVEPEQVYRRYEQKTGQGVVSSESLGECVEQGSTDIPVMEITEKIIPMHRPVYVLGEAADRSGQLMIQAPSEKDKAFIISVKSKEELTRTTAGAAKLSMILAIIFGMIGMAFIAYGILSTM
jgi:hypothetical protein